MNDSGGEIIVTGHCRGVHVLNEVFLIEDVIEQLILQLSDFHHLSRDAANFFATFSNVLIQLVIFVLQLTKFATRWFRRRNLRFFIRFRTILIIEMSRRDRDGSRTRDTR